MKRLWPLIKELAKGATLPQGVTAGDVEASYLFGSSIKGGTYNDVDVALFVDEQHPLLKYVAPIVSQKVNNIEYHVLPSVPWAWRQFVSSLKGEPLYVELPSYIWKGKTWAS